MRILVVTNMYPTEAMPAFGTFVYEQVQSLRRKGLVVDVLFINGKRDTWNYARGAWQVLRQVRVGAYDIVHAHYVFSGVLARLQSRYPLVVSFHGAGEMAGWVGWLCKALAPWVDAFTVTSAEHAAQLGRQGAQIVPCGIDLELFRPMPQREARQRLGLGCPSPAAEDRKLVLFAADLRPEKRIDVARQAIALLQQEGEPVELVVATGRPHEEVPLFMNACDAFVLPSLSEGLPIALLEAMAAKRACVVTDIGLPVHDGVDALVVPPKNVDALARALNKVLGDAALRKRLGENANARVKKEFSWTRAVDAYFKLARELVD
jgi:glycosyltransferase involved in cell wall biosynthesis